MSEVTGYSVAFYGNMIDCEPRMGTYDAALRKAITPGCTVIDIGAGFGVFSLLACKYGAGHVIAIEPDPSIELVMPLARANGCADRITVVRDMSTNYTPEHKADVIVSDIRGSSPLFEHNIPTIKDARARLLKPGGALLPMRDTVRLALVNSAKTYRSSQYPWLSNRYDLDLSAVHGFAANKTSSAALGVKSMVSEAATLAVLDYRTITDPNIDTTLELVATHDRTAHGLLMWFDAEIAEGISFSTGPGQPKMVYGQMFFPLLHPVKMKRGDRMMLRMRATHTGSGYIWTWDSQFIDQATGKVASSFNQSSFGSKVYSKDLLKTMSNHYVPEATKMMQVDADCLGLVGEGRDLDTIAKAMLDRHADVFQSYQQALDRVVSLFDRYRRA